MRKSQLKKSKTGSYNFLSSLLQDPVLRVCLLFIICNLALGIWNLPAFAEDKIVAIVNEDVITQKDLDDFLNFMRVQLSAEYKGQELEKKIKSMKGDLINKLIDDRLILQEAKKAGLMADNARVAQRLTEIKKQYASEMQFQAALRQQGLVQADIEEKIRDQILTYGFIDTKIKNKVLVRPSEVTNFYNNNRQEFKSEEYREFLSLAVADEKTTKEIYAALKKGTDFQQIAKDYSLKPDTLRARKGRDLKKDLEEALFKLNIGEISEPLKVADQYYIFKLADIVPEKELNLAQAQDEIYSFLIDRKAQDELANYLNEVKSRSYIKIF